METNKCQRAYVYLTIWTIFASVLLFIVRYQTLNPQYFQPFKRIPQMLSYDAPRSTNVSMYGNTDSALTLKPLSNKISTKRHKQFPAVRVKQSVEINTNSQVPSAGFRNVSSFRNRFLLWDKANTTLTSSIGPDLVTTTDQYLIYRCDSGGMRFCGGWADRIKGTLIAYMIANLTGRVFKIEMLNPPCDLLRYVTPNMANWSLPTSIHENTRKQRDARAINAVDNVPFLYKIPTTNFTQMLEEKKAKYIYFKANLDYGEQLQKSKIYSQQLAWLSGLSNDQIMSTLFTRLFKLSNNMRTKMDAFMAMTLPTPEHKLICAHVRMGKNPTIPSDTNIQHSEADLALVWKFFSQHSKTDEHKIFLMSDSENAVRFAKSQPFAHRIVDSGGPIQHIDKSGGYKLEDRCDAMEKVIFDQHVLMQCDVLLISKSGISRMAAYVRGSDKGLYCFMKSGKIYPCTTNIIKRLYRVMG